MPPYPRQRIRVTPRSVRDLDILERLRRADLSDHGGEETADMLAKARMTIEAEKDCVQGERNARQADATVPGHPAAYETIQQPVIPEGRMVDFQIQWQRSPNLRCLIRAATPLTDAECEGSRLLLALREMSRSHEWIYERGGRLPIDEFFVLFDDAFEGMMKRPLLPTVHGAATRKRKRRRRV